RGKGGLKCAVGVLIKDEFYSEDFESVIPIQVSNPSKSKKMLWEALENSLNIELDNNSKAFLDELQGIHDNREDFYKEEDREENIKHWGNRLKIFAENHNLTY
ncbi:MAG: hypothetical protein R3230_01170, partial [Nitrosopumilaceae archaeon]|nr:hypothetical protein [Nitrosopumilaceae archaeon]